MGAVEVQNTRGRLAKLPRHQCERRRAGKAGGRKRLGTAPAGLGSPEGNGVKQEMKNGNAACHAQGNNNNDKKNVIMLWQLSASRPELTGPDR